MLFKEFLPCPEISEVGGWNNPGKYNVHSKYEQEYKGEKVPAMNFKKRHQSNRQMIPGFAVKFQRSAFCRIG